MNNGNKRNITTTAKHEFFETVTFTIAELAEPSKKREPDAIPCRENICNLNEPCSKYMLL